MAPKNPSAKQWLDALRPASRARGMRFVSQTAFAVDDVYITSLEARVLPQAISWAVDIKPMALDDVLWAAFMPDVVVGAQMRINRRIDGAFQVRPLRIASGTTEMSVGAGPDWEPVLDEFDRARTEFITTHPTPSDFAARLEATTSGLSTGHDLVRLVTALTAAGRAPDAARLAGDAVSRGERGPMSSKVDVLKYLAAHAGGPEAYEEFTASLVPTHNLQVVHHTDRSTSVDLARDHHPGRIAERLGSMDGANPWAVVLSVLAPVGGTDDPSTSSYVQAAGTAEAMVLEWCRPAAASASGTGAMAVRSAVGRPHADQDPSVVEVPMPHGVEQIAQHEVFTAEQAAELFERFYRSDSLGDGVVLRPVEGYAADGTRIDLRDPTSRSSP